jgi:hypothetical protein
MTARMKATAMATTMAANPPERIPRRIAVILGTGQSGRKLLDLVLPLLTRDREIEMHGVFLEEAEVQHAAELPFVQELCRVTFSVREFTSDQFERALTLRMRTAQRALAVLARRIGVSHSFRNIRGPAVRLLRETARVSDITVFEPARMMTPPAARLPGARRSSPRIVVAMTDLESGRMALLAAFHLAEGDASRISILAAADLARDQPELERLFRELLPAQPLRVRIVPPDGGVRGLVGAAQAEGAALFVCAATEELLEQSNLQFLREKLRCPICLVRQWDGRRILPLY